MGEFKLVIGNRNYSSWSLRGWLAAKQAGITFDEIFVNLGKPDYKQQLKKHSDAAKVPVLIHGDRVIWDSLAIIEYLADLYPKAGIWPDDLEARAKARCVSSEMHSSFSALRDAMPMNIRKSLPGKGRNAGVDQDIERITEIWRSCRNGYQQAGPFLFGPWTGADTMYAPVVSRFRTYAVELDPTCKAYAESVLNTDWFKTWEANALKETWIVAEDEID